MKRDFISLPSIPFNSIRTLRLVGNDLHDIDKFKEDDSEEEEEEKEEVTSQQRGGGDKKRHQKIGVSAAEEEGSDYEMSGINSTKELNEELDKQSESTAVVMLKYFSILVILAMILM